MYYIHIISAQQVPYSATVRGHPVRPGNGDEMLVKDSPSSICMQSDRKFYKRYWGMQLTGILWIKGPYHEVLLNTD